MRTFILSLVVVAAIGSMACKNKKSQSTQPQKHQQTVNVSFGVRGNCGMCKRTIEEAAKKVPGVIKATWDKKAKKIDIIAHKDTDIKAVHLSIAKAGYDTEKVSADEQKYQDLMDCCQYDRQMPMNQ